jgi:hypothetical protein
MKGNMIMLFFISIFPIMLGIIALFVTLHSIYHFSVSKFLKYSLGTLFAISIFFFAIVIVVPDNSAAKTDPTERHKITHS